MKRNFGAFLILFLTTTVIVYLFSKWWLSRTGTPSFPAEAMASPTPRVSNLAGLLSKMRPLQESEETFELASSQDGVTGLVRYLKEGDSISFTVYINLEKPLDQAIFLWLKEGNEFKNLGELKDGKGGWLVSNSLPSSRFPAQLVVATEDKGEPGLILLGGIIKL